MKSARLERINSLIHEYLGQIILKEGRWVKHHFISLLQVDTSPDLENCKVYISIWGSPEEKQEAFKLLKRDASYFRYHLGKTIELRKIPKLHFILDNSLEIGQRVSNSIANLSPSPNPKN